MLENWNAMRRFRRAKRLSRKGSFADAKAVCLEALEIAGRAPRQSVRGDCNARLTTLAVLGMLGATALDLGDREEARRALREWTALYAESRNLYPLVFERGDLLGEDWVRRKLDALEGLGAARAPTALA